MEIKDKQLFKIEVKNKIDKFVKEFPVHFYGNMLINLVFVLLILVIGFFLTISIKIRSGGEFFAYGLVLMVAIMAALRITFNSFLRNLDILRDMQTGKYVFGIENHEMDNAVEFIEELPMKKEEVDKLRTSLSFDKLINVLEATRIISCENNEYVMDIVFRYKMIDILNDESHLKKSPEA